MSKHSLQTRGQTFMWDDDVNLNTPEDTLLKLYGRVSNMWSHSMYEGEDPNKRWNDHVAKVQENLIDWVIEERNLEALKDKTHE